MLNHGKYFAKLNTCRQCIKDACEISDLRITLHIFSSAMMAVSKITYRYRYKRRDLKVWVYVLWASNVVYVFGIQRALPALIWSSAL